MKAKPLSPLALAAARRVLDDAGVVHPRDIHVEAIAARRGAMVIFGASSTSKGHLVRAGRRAIVHVDARAKDTPSARFTIAHELAHLEMHEAEDHFLQCERGAPERGPSFHLERQANDFAAELLVPEALAAPFARADEPSIDDLDRVARAFRVPFEMAAIRFVHLTRAACAAILAREGTIVWACESASFPGRAVRKRPIHPAAIASSIVGTRAVELTREVPGEAWSSKLPLRETALRRGTTTLSFVVLPAPREPRL